MVILQFRPLYLWVRSSCYPLDSGMDKTGRVDVEAKRKTSVSVDYRISVLQSLAVHFTDWAIHISGVKKQIQSNRFVFYVCVKTRDDEIWNRFHPSVDGTVKGKVFPRLNWSPRHVEIGESGGIASPFLTSALDRGEWSTSPPPPVVFYVWGNSARYQLCRELDVSQIWLGRYGEQKGPLPLLGMEPRLGHPACSLAAMPTAIPAAYTSWYL
jgi:hypothetical protein